MGERMFVALRDALRVCERAILIGSDCPLLGMHDLVAADAILRAAADVVLAPALDGGYVLVGMREPHAAPFAGVEWGTASVMAQTRACLSSARLDWRELPARADIDVASDLRHLPPGWLDDVTQRAP